MELISTQLILHKYTQEYLEEKCSIETLKDANVQLDKEELDNHRFKEDIKHSDIAFSIKELGNKEEYGFFFFKTNTATEGNIMYSLKKVVLDKNLPTDYLHKRVIDVVSLLNNGNFLRKDRLVANDNYPLIYYTLNDTSEKLANYIINVFLSKNKGIAYLPSDVEENLKRAAQKENAPE